MSWKITFYSDKVEKETLAFPTGILAHTIHIMEMIEEFGPNLGKPHTAPMGDGLFEIRAKGKEGIGRSLFAVVIEEEVVILNSFIKKSQKTPKKELEKARKRLKELKNENNT
jgi:phage-related protein